MALILAGPIPGIRVRASSRIFSSMVRNPSS
jgi:hypothetical protein